jgi:hypothetical protein
MARQFFSPFRPPSPRRFVAGFRDLGQFLRTRERRDYLIAAVSAGITGFILFAFWHDSRAEPMQQVLFVQSWRADRPDSEIIAEQKQERAARDKAIAERQAAFGKIKKATDRWL